VKPSSSSSGKRATPSSTRSTWTNHVRPLPVGNEGDIRFPDLAKKIVDEWTQNGSHRGDLKDDKKIDQAVLHTDNSTPFSDVVAVIDAIYTPKRDCSICERGKSVKMPGFNVTFSVN